MQDNISILYTNDIHSHLEHWPQIRRYLQTQKRHLIREGRSVLTFDIGDALDRQHPLTEATMGQANVALLNEIGYDAVTIGNNEGLGLAHDDMNHLYDHANFSVVLGNVTDMQTGEVPDWAVTHKIITTPKGTRVGVLGLTAPFILTLPLLGWMPEKVTDALDRQIPELTDQVDFIVLLSHLGLPTDRYLATHYPDLNVIIGAHTHHLLVNGERYGDTMLAAAGRYGDHIGRIDLTVEDGHLSAVEATTVVTDELPTLPEDRVEIAGYQTSGEQQLAKRVVAELPTAYTNGLQGEHRLIDLGLEALKARTHTDVAMLSTGLFLTDLPAGIVTANDLHALLPHAVHPMRSTLKGHDLWRLAHEIEKNRNFLRPNRLRGMGFRGDTWGEVVWSGLRIDANGDVFIHDQPIDLDATYTIGSLDHYLFIPYFPTLEIAGQNVMSYDTVIREDFAAYLAETFLPNKEEN